MDERHFKVETKSESFWKFQLQHSSQKKKCRGLNLFEQHVPLLDTPVSKSIEQLLAIL
jgi:hypothetical protein